MVHIASHINAASTSLNAADQFSIPSGNTIVVAELRDAQLTKTTIK